MTEPLLFKKLQRLAELSGYADLSFHAYNPDSGLPLEGEKHWSVYDPKSRIHTFPTSYKDLMEDLKDRIAKQKAKEIALALEKINLVNKRFEEDQKAHLSSENQAKQEWDLEARIAKLEAELWTS